MISRSQWGSVPSSLRLLDNWIVRSWEVRANWFSFKSVSSGPLAIPAGSRVSCLRVGDSAGPACDPEVGLPPAVPVIGFL